MIDVVQFRELVIRNTLAFIGQDSPAAEELLLGTAIQESRLTYLKQLGGGPALGVYQMEPATHDDIWDNYLIHRTELALSVKKTTAYPGVAAEMIANLMYATAMCRMHYRRRPEPLPEAGDVEGMADYWKEHYNTHLGAGTVDEYIEHWETYGPNSDD